MTRIVVSHHPHHIAQRGNNRADVFFDDEDRTAYLSFLKEYCEKYTINNWHIV
jgi:putative transposase